jgi:hypothetical protein
VGDAIDVAEGPGGGLVEEGDGIGGEELLGAAYGGEA